ncbi:hypothetical protein ACIO87_33555 [Streptomyces sp. NPDC087218]|uniref:hypothetical protein n=1 Tax=Streptomyces sp. NPDC087218 TaxID=3365769 RepID=UPI003809E092
MSIYQSVVLRFLQRVEPLVHGERFVVEGQGVVRVGGLPGGAEPGQQERLLEGGRAPCDEVEGATEHVVRLLYASRRRP